MHLSRFHRIYSWKKSKIVRLTCIERCRSSAHDEAIEAPAFMSAVEGFPGIKQHAWGQSKI
ncbi:MAG: hypothetical protein HC785_11830 [Calothrix sp. CSU_2_0]|nr:hypothetical protein [Calothrix sp. CSU_2_0]